jgi:transposase-like protein
VRLVFDNDGQHGSRWQAIGSIAANIGCSGHTLREGVKKADVDCGKRAGIAAEMAERMRALERENRELRQGEEDQGKVRGNFPPANEILRKASACFAMAELDRRSK